MKNIKVELKHGLFEVTYSEADQVKHFTTKTIQEAFTELLNLEEKSNV